MISVSYDEENGIVCTVAKGFASVEDFNLYMPKATELMERSRAQHGRALHLVDAADNPVQSRDTFDHIAKVATPNMADGDLCALVLNSALVRLQINRMGNSFTREFFTDQEAAKAWLLAGGGQ